MSANPSKIFSAADGPAHLRNSAEELTGERRRRTRTSVRWAVLIFRDTISEPIESVTENLSGSGFYCLVRSQFVPGEVLSCTLTAPSYDPMNSDSALILECRARVVWTQTYTPKEGFSGVGCEIEDYRLPMAQAPKQK